MIIKDFPSSSSPLAIYMHPKITPNNGIITETTYIQHPLLSELRDEYSALLEYTDNLPPHLSQYSAFCPYVNLHLEHIFLYE